MWRHHWKLATLTAGTATSIYVTNALWDSNTSCIVHGQASGRNSPHKTATLEATGAATDLQLKSVQILFRHGTRTPFNDLSPLLTDHPWEARFLSAGVPYATIDHAVVDLSTGSVKHKPKEGAHGKSRLLGGMPAVALTDLGRDEAYTLGRTLKKRYIQQMKFVNGKFDAQELYIRSTDRERTIETMANVLAGMFGRSSFTPDSPAVIQVEDWSRETLHPNYHYCPYLGYVQNQVVLQQNGALEKDEQREARLEIQKLIGYSERAVKLIGPLPILLFRDNLDARRRLGLPRPAKLLPLEEKIDKLATELFQQCLVEGEAQLGTLRLHSGPTLNLLSDNMQKSKNNDICRNPMMHLFSCHDQTLLPLLVILGCYDGQWPPPASSLALELYEDHKGCHFVQILYCGKEMVLEGYQGTMIPYKEFYKKMEPYILDMESQEYRDLCTEMTSKVFKPEDLKIPDISSRQSKKILNSNKIN